MLPGSTFLPSRRYANSIIVPALARRILTTHRAADPAARYEIIEHLGDATPRNQQLLLACDLVDALLDTSAPPPPASMKLANSVVDQRKQADIVAEIVEYSGYCGLDAAVWRFRRTSPSSTQPIAARASIFSRRRAG